ncbi:cytochrome P450 [Daedaleopsis nitida]|nr:cytochrome P450 [Daedaleopsis nitida]
MLAPLLQVFVKSPLDNIPGPPVHSFLYGNLRQILDKDGWGFLQHLTESYPGVAKLSGPLGHRMLYVFDPTALHSIIVKDQHIFEEAAFFIKSNMLHFGPGLLATLGDRHRKQRKLLNPVFSIAHMRRMIPIFNTVAHRLTEAIETRVSDHAAPVEVDMIAWMGRTALELIGQAGLGYSFDSLVADTPDALGTAIKAFQPTISKINIFRRLVPYILDIGPVSFRRALLGFIPHNGVQELKHIIDTMHDQSVEIFQAKKRALEQGDEAVVRQIGEGKDIMSILLRANMAAAEEDKLPEDELIAQMSTFILAAMDTTSNALAIVLQLLAERPDAQERLRSEILDASKGEDLEYDALVSLPYLDAVCRETLRLHAPVATVFRETRQDVVLPLSEPITGLDGRTLHEIPVPADTTVAVGLLSSNRNTALWGPDALEWKPERWLAPLPESVTGAKVPGVYSNLMTFLGGGRACIGFKFSQLEMSECRLPPPHTIHSRITHHPRPHPRPRPTASPWLAEVVLCMLLARFTFAPADKRIIWNLSGVRFPTVAGGSKPSMPLKVALYKPAPTCRRDSFRFRCRSYASVYIITTSSTYISHVVLRVPLA